MNITCIAHSYHKKISWIWTLEYTLKYYKNSDTNARTQVRGGCAGEFENKGMRLKCSATEKSYGECGLFPGIHCQKGQGEKNEGKIVKTETCKTRLECAKKCRGVSGASKSTMWKEEICANVSVTQDGEAWVVREILQVRTSVRLSSPGVLSYLPWILRVLVSGRSFLSWILAEIRIENTYLDLPSSRHCWMERHHLIRSHKHRSHGRRENMKVMRHNNYFIYIKRGGMCLSEKPTTASRGLNWLHFVLEQQSSQSQSLIWSNINLMLTCSSTMFLKYCPLYLCSSVVSVYGVA